MSVLIRGMEIPKNRAVYIAIDNGVVFVKPLGALHWQRLDEPCVELPPHGRLIDADELIAEHSGIFDCCVFPSDIREAPTILEAEP